MPLPIDLSQPFCSRWRDTPTFLEAPPGFFHQEPTMPEQCLEPTHVHESETLKRSRTVLDQPIWGANRKLLSPAPRDQAR
jgi:hypothetical protein